MPKQSTNKETTYALINAMISPEGAAGIDTASASGTGQSKAYDLIEKEVRDWYPYEVVQNPNLPKDHPIAISLDPPVETEGEIVGIAEWTRAWQEAKLG
jgi:spermidine/putrescine-binding protein